MFWDARRFLFGAPEEGNISDNLPEHNGRRRPAASVGQHRPLSSRHPGLGSQVLFYLPQQRTLLTLLRNDE